MKDATLVMSEESMPTLSLIARLHAKLVMAAENHPGDSETSREVKLVIAQDLSKRYSTEMTTLYMASAVDPPFQEEEEAVHIYSTLTDPVVAEIQKHTCEQEGDNEETEGDEVIQSSHPDDDQLVTSPPPWKRPRASSVLSELLGTFASARETVTQKSAHDVAKAVVKRFKNETPLPLCGDPLHWWKEHEAAYPHVAEVARCFLCIPGTSIPSERVFSSAGDIVTSQRSVLKAGHVDQLVFLHKNDFALSLH
ncbi:E3 SUMO-protein ligase ZBED1-like [Boleophthalmus pectinirostris]|uniref:E3 SUMO-protein ligase ZBED1-like n=1 Tax=Boleophthalmus pectinirostris TaxID=150288 RepID=UPI00242BEDDA|nr:E3 SUMO-protein ligase ZBED1-like [Boleophthalmus pectinirostris]